jgi:TonB family protein
MRKVAAFLLVVAAVGCGHGEDSRRDDSAVTRRAGWRPGTGPDDPSTRSDVKIENELGVLDTSDVEDAIAERFEELRGCYGHAGKAQRYAGGKVLLRFLIGGSGRADDVLVAESDLGNYSVERCLVHVGRSIAFKAPEGGKSTTFDYPIEFRPSGPLTILNLNGLKVERDLSVQMPQLASCGRLATQPIAAILYIEPRGLVGSVGLSGAAPMDEATASCIVRTIQRWRMSAKLPGHVLRCNFSIPPVVASAEPPPRAAAGISRRRRR